MCNQKLNKLKIPLESMCMILQYNNNFRYVTQKLTPELDNVVISLLTKLNKFQKKVKQNDPLKVQFIHKTNVTFLV